MDPSYKERLFVAYYLGVSNGNGTDAAARAGYGSTRDSARVIAVRLLAKVSVRAAIEAKLTSAAMPADEVLARMADIASASLGDFIRVEGETYRLDLSRGKRRGKLHTLKKIKTTREGTEIEVKDALPALVKLGEYHGLWDREQVPGLTMEKLAEIKRTYEHHRGDPDPGGDAGGVRE